MGDLSEVYRLEVSQGGMMRKLFGSVRPFRPRSLLTAAVVGLALLSFALPGAAAASAPGNDDFATATAITSLPFSATVSIGDSTTEPNEPFFCTFMPQTVWYRYQPATSGYVKVGLTSDVTDAFVEVFTGTSLDALQADGCFPSAQGQDFFFLQAGVTYYFQVGTQSVESGNVGLTLQAPRAPTNDDLGQAMQINSLLPLDDFVDMSAATFAPGDPTDCFSGIPNIWYAFTPAVDTRLAISSRLGQPSFSVYSGSPGSLQLVSCGSFPYVLDAKKGSTYYIEIVDQETIDLIFGEAFALTNVTVDQRATVEGTSGSVTVGGTVTCNAQGDALVNIDLTQRLNSKLVAEGVVTLFPSCSTASTAWTGTVVPFFGPSVGPFRPGAATINVTISACGTPPGSIFTCDSKVVTQSVLLLPRT
jgi:hypothetical protein